ncbi:phosphatase PAP2 family protein [Mesorhizobium xinjiangense]|uniref:phosphatase PAP2 family protein n=1 Tax=Mesorhizobium xinjiangense TaxID=2678685 RepID=UPI0012EECD4A|nr:phosphatase PAP2 family protein [Mesorhizobium xinjiangense]
MQLHPGERIAAIIIVLLLVLDLTMILHAGQAVDWIGYASAGAMGLAVFGIGQVYRFVGRDERIAMTATAAGLFILFTLVASLFNYLLLPVGGERIDTLLIAIDTRLGYSWPDLVAAVTQVPPLGSVLRFVYLSSLPQLVVVILVLGFAGRRDQLHRFLLTGLLGAILTIGIWTIAPSSGPSAYYDLPEHVESALGIVVGSDYGAELNRLMANGSSRISPKDALGLIAFPSFHTVMALMSVWFMASVRPLFPLFLSVNLLMVPAILVHGGHHLVDLAGGAVVFVLGLYASRKILAVPYFATGSRAMGIQDA